MRVIRQDLQWPVGCMVHLSVNAILMVWYMMCWLVPLSMAGQTFLGWLTDSTGCFRIKGLEAGTYHLKAEYVGLAPCDTVITLPLPHNDTLRMVLPLWYDYILKYDCSPELS